jgi:hypothetical protein
MDLCSAIRGFEPINGDWRPLDDLIGQLCRHPLTDEGIDALLAVLERFPTEDGAGVLWSIVHALEHEEPVRYQPRLLASLRRTPAELSVTMVNRILNTGERDLAGVSALQVLADIAARQDIDASIRKTAKSFLARHAS